MKTALNRFRKRNMQTNIVHILLVIFVVAISVCLIAGLSISHLTLKNSTEKFLNNSNLPSYWIKTDKISQEDEKYFSKYEYDKRYSFETSFMADGGEHQGKILVSNGKVSTPYIVEGDKGKGCFVDAKFAEKYKIAVNYSQISFKYDFQEKTETIQLNVVGLISLAEDLLIDEKCTIFIDEEVFLNLLKSEFSDIGDADLSIINYNELLVKSELSEKDIKDIQSYYQQSSSNLLSVLSKEDVVSFRAISQELRISSVMTCSLPILFVIVAILVVVATISGLISKEGYNIGLLRSFGVKNKEIISNYCGYGVFMCVVGTVLGLLLSWLIVPNVTFDLYDSIYNLPRDEVGMVFPVSLIAIMLVVAIVIGFLSSFFICLRFVRMTPKECMDGRKKSYKARKNRKNKFGMIGSVFKNMQINKTRSVMSIVGVAGCSSLCIIGFGVGIVGAISNNNVLSIGKFLSIFQAFSILILILTVYILGMQIFKERAREMAMLRIHGQSHLKIWLTLLFEMIIIALIGFAISCLISYPLILIVVKILSVDANIFISFMGVLKTFLIVFAIILVVASLKLINVYKLRLADMTKFSE